MTAITPRAAGSAEERIDAAAAERLDAPPAALSVAAWNPDTIAEAYLPLLAWTHSLDEWNPAWDAQTKRDAIRGAVAAHRRKGTAAGVKGVLDRIGAEYDYAERPAGDPFTAAVDIRNPASIRKSDAVTVGQLITAHKRGTVHMTVTLHSGLRGEIPVAGGIGSLVVARFDLDANP